MDFVAKLYCIIFPVLLLLFSIGRNKKNYFNLLFIANILMLLNAVFIIRQWMGIYYLTQQWHVAKKGFHLADYMGSLFYVQAVILILPFLFFFQQKLIQITVGAILFILVLCFQASFIFYSFSEIIFTTLNYISLFIAVYALFWLIKKLPYQ